MRIVGLGTAVPEGSVAQSSAAALSRPLAGADGRQQRLLDSLFRRSGVDRRHSVLLDNQGENPQQEFYPPRQGDGDRGPRTRDRMREYERHAARLAIRAAERALSDSSATISHLLTVSCTGFHAPGIDVRLIEPLGLSPEVRRAHIGFMGCHGMFNALALARSIVGAEPAARVLVVAVELCSLHFHYGWDPDRLVANALFADGAAAVVCEGAERDGAAALLRIEAHGSRLLPESTDAMTWRIGDHGFEMTLSPRVPGLIREHVGRWLDHWLGVQGLSLEHIRHWAVHPGGPRVLAAFEQAVELDSGGLVASRAILGRYGNMSSVTVAFIIERLLEEQSIPGPGVAVGFGPGLMAEAFLFRLG